MRAIWRREMGQFFLTPVGYIFLGIFLLMGGVFFSAFNLYAGSSSLDTFFGNIIYLFMVICPLLTMRLLSEEKHARTDQLLLTSPLSISSIVAGKYLSALTMLLISLLLTAPLILIIIKYATPYYGLIASNYLGFFLLSSCYLAIGELMSAVTESQITAAVLTYAVILLLQVLEAMAPSLSSSGSFTLLAKALSYCSLYGRYFTFTQGIVSVASVVFYICFDAVLLFITGLVIAKRKWSDG